MRLSALRSLFLAHDLVRKPDTTFRDHAMRETNQKSFVVVVVGKPRARIASRERDFYFVIAGLDPAIHAAAKLVQILRVVSLVSLQHGPPGQARW